MKNVPTLRFKDDNGRDFPAWITEFLLSLSENGFSNGVFNDPSKVGSGYKLVNVSDMYIESTIDERNLTLVNIDYSEFVKNKVEKGDVFFTRSSLVKEGIACSNVYLGESQDITFDGHLVRMRPKKNLINSVFLNYLLKTKEIRKQLVARGKTATMTTIGQSDIATVNIIFPSANKEQTKIADFLTAIDDRISQLSQKCDGLAQYKKGVMQKIFSQELRFKDEKGRAFPAWEEKRLGDVFTEILDKIGDADIETYSISAGKGFVSQKEKFGRDISGMQNSKYIKLKPSEFAYNKGSSKAFVYGCVYPNTTGKEIGVPNVFICFRSMAAVATGFYAKLFERNYLDKHLKNIISSSARLDGLLNVNKVDFFNILLPYPCFKEQEKIAGFLGALDEKISHAQSQLAALKQYKQGLLQQMFV